VHISPYNYKTLYRGFVDFLGKSDEVSLAVKDAQWWRDKIVHIEKVIKVITLCRIRQDFAGSVPVLM